MVDELETDSPPSPSPIKTAFWFLTTLLLVPFLFVGTCIPVTFSLVMMPHSSGINSFTVYMAIFTGACLFAAFKVKNIGARFAFGFYAIVLGLLLIGFLANSMAGV